jgi:hypothetical protein
VWKHGVQVLEWLLHLERWASYGPSQQLPFPYRPTGERRHLLHGPTHTFKLVSRGLWVLLRYGLGALACSLRWCAHLPGTPLHEFGAVLRSMLLAQHLVQPTTSLQESHMTEAALRGVGQGNGLNIRHLLQLPLKLALSAIHLHCLRFHFVLKQFQFM